MAGNDIIFVENLTHAYNNGYEAINNISFGVQRGEMTAIIGQNGAGKTTLVKHFNGLLKPASGRVLVDGMDTSREKVSTLAKKVGFVFQNPDHQIFKNTVREEVAFGPANLGLSQEEVAGRVEEALQAVELKNYADASPQNLSKGQRQRVALASVLAMKTEVIVLDEPTTGQDYKESLQIMDLAQRLNDDGHTILFITHDMSLVARYARRALVLCEGSVLLDGPVEDVFNQGEALNRTFLHPPQIVQLAGALTDYGIPKGILSPHDLQQVIIDTVRGRKNVSCS